MNDKTIERNYQNARERYASEFGIDTDKAIKVVQNMPLALHCWQGDDVAGFERSDSALEGGGIQVTGNYPGRARTPTELRADMDKAFSLIPGELRANLHAIYGEFGGKRVERDEVAPEHFKGWIDWAKSRKIGLDFNSTCFGHPKSADGYTISSANAGIREFWIEHVQRCRKISAVMGKDLGNPCIHNLWIQDGCKDNSVDRWGYRSRLKQSLDRIFKVKYPHKEMKDAIEGKLFGIGSEAFVVGSNDFYLAYAVKNNLLPCMDMGHYHPTESVADKISAVLQFCPELLLHVSRGIRWDSDHVVTLNDDVKSLMEEIARIPALDRVNLALDFFDGSINRVGAWVVGARASLKALLIAVLEPTARLREYEKEGNGFARLALLEECKTMPYCAVWAHLCMKCGVPATESEVIDQVMDYQAKVQSKRK